MARPGRRERNKVARSLRQLRRFHHVINSDKVFGTHSAAAAYQSQISPVSVAGGTAHLQASRFIAEMAPYAPAALCNSPLQSWNNPVCSISMRMAACSRRAATGKPLFMFADRAAPLPSCRLAARRSMAICWTPFHKFKFRAGRGFYLFRGSLAQHRPEDVIPKRCANAIVSCREFMMASVML
jgi:hypothetical protein